MNKDVIYIEPEDDITDVITKIEKAKSKIVALVPPKKAGIFRSIVNIKLIAKTGLSAEKNIVIVTTDPSIVRLAAATKIPVTENLQSAPSVPVIEDEVEDKNEASASEIAEKPLKKAEKSAKKDEEAEESEKAEESEEEDSDETEEETEVEDDKENDDKQKKTTKKVKLTGNKVIDWIKMHKKITIFSGAFGVLVILFLVWAFAIAPAVDIAVTIKTDKKTFSENISFTTSLEDENIGEGKFYVEEKKIEEVKEIPFEATGQKNVGEKATGDVVVYAYFKKNGTVPIAAGTKFTINGLVYASDEAVNIVWDGTDGSVCDNKNNPASLINSGCMVSARVNVTATASGEKYNISKSASGWDTAAQVGVYSDNSMSGGTDKYVTVVQQSDVEKAKESLTASGESASREKLYETISDDDLVIEGSFKQETSDVVSTPAIDAEVSDGEEATLKVTTTATVYVVEKARLEQFITEKAKLSDNQKIYQIKNTYIESFVETNEKMSAKLKANYFIGPEITEGALVEKILGKGLGDARREISDIYGVFDVSMNPSFPWVMSVPGDSNKIKITFEIKDQDGNEIKDEKSDNVKEENE